MSSEATSSPQSPTGGPKSAPTTPVKKSATGAPTAPGTPDASPGSTLNDSPGSTLNDSPGSTSSGPLGSTASPSPRKSDNEAETASGVTDDKTSDTDESPESPEDAPRVPWDINDTEDPVPKGIPYVPFYGRKRNSSWRENDETEPIRVNWVCRYPQDSKLSTDDHEAGSPIERMLTDLAAKRGFKYVWVVRGPVNPTPNIGPGIMDSDQPETPQWSVGACFGPDEKTCQVYGNVYVDKPEIRPNGNRVVKGLLDVGDKHPEERELLVPDGRVLDLWAAHEHNMPRPFAPKEKKQRKKKSKAKASTDDKNKALKPGAEPENRITKSAARRARQKANLVKELLGGGEGVNKFTAEFSGAGDCSVNFKSV